MKETEKFKQIAIKAALKGGEILEENRGKVRKVEFKGEVNLVTEVDRLSEEAILKIIRENFPDHTIITEESEGYREKSGYKWLIDPLDGTTNYAHDFPVYCVSVALEKEDQIILGVVYNPILKELFVAEKGMGAFLSTGSKGNQKKISVSQTQDLSRSLLATGFPYDIRESEINNLDHFANFAVKAQAVRRAGSAALDLCYLAMGRFDGFWELKLHPWDTAAASLLVTEAGGEITDFVGNPFNIHSKEILATNGKIQDQMIQVLKLGKRVETSG